jgi:hypothetical protein
MHLEGLRNTTVIVTQVSRCPERDLNWAQPNVSETLQLESTCSASVSYYQTFLSLVLFFLVIILTHVNMRPESESFNALIGNFTILFKRWEHIGPNEFWQNNNEL